jgi:hypothetical protein
MKTGRGHDVPTLAYDSRLICQRDGGPSVRSGPQLPHVNTSFVGGGGEDLANSSHNPRFCPK